VSITICSYTTELAIYHTKCERNHDIIKMHGDYPNIDNVSLENQESNMAKVNIT
jgi:hypothetical protein